VHWRLLLGARMQVNYEFHDELTLAKVDEIIADYSAKAAEKDGK